MKCPYCSEPVDERNPHAIHGGILYHMECLIDWIKTKQGRQEVIRLYRSA